MANVAMLRKIKRYKKQEPKKRYKKQDPKKKNQEPNNKNQKKEPRTNEKYQKQSAKIGKPGLPDLLNQKQ